MIERDPQNLAHLRCHVMGSARRGSPDQTNVSRVDEEEDRRIKATGSGANLLIAIRRLRAGAATLKTDARS